MHIKKYFFLVFIFFNSVQFLGAQMQQFILPIDGIYLKDFYLVNYVDWKYVGIEDYQCGNKTYDGHQGTDFVIRNFSQMDSGINIFAAEDGIVAFVIDTFFDRNKTAEVGGLGNYIAIKHESLFYTYYGHLKKNSALVNIGDTVFAGEIIGQVGSSGYTSDPHLHFEVWYDSLYNWDPFSGPCGNPESLFFEPLAYIDTFGIIDHDFNAFIPTLDTLKERLPGKNVFLESDLIINFWIQGFGVFPGDKSTLRWYAPDGTVYETFNYDHTEEWWYYYWWSYIPIPDISLEGMWQAKYFVNEELKIIDTFYFQADTLIENLFLEELMQPIIFENNAGNIIFKFPEITKTPVEIKIFDLSGTLILNKTFLSGNFEYEINNISEKMKTGIYFIHFSETYQPTKLFYASQ